MQVSGILETALSVADPAASAAFYKRLFGFDTLLDTDRLIALNVAGRNVLLLFRKGATEEPATLPGGVIPPTGRPGRATSPSRSRRRTSSRGRNGSRRKAWPSRAS